MLFTSTSLGSLAALPFLLRRAGSDGAKAFAGGLAASSVQWLGLGGNDLGDTGVIYLASALKGQASQAVAAIFALFLWEHQGVSMTLFVLTAASPFFVPSELQTMAALCSPWDLVETT